MRGEWQELRQRVSRLETELAAAKAKLRDPSNRILVTESSVTSLLIRLQEELLNPISAIIANASLWPEVYSDMECARLTKATKLAAFRLESTVTKVVTVAQVATRSFELKPTLCSVHAICHEASLLATSLSPPDCDCGCSVSLSPQDMIVELDPRRIVQAIAAIIRAQSRHRPCGISTLKLHVHNVSNLIADLEIAILPSKKGRASPRLSVLQPQSTEGRIGSLMVLDAVFISVLAAEMGITVTERTNGASTITMRVSLPIRRIVEQPEPSIVDEQWIRAPIAVINEPPPGFTPLRARVVCIPDDIDIEARMKEEDARLLVLYQPDDNDEFAVLRNLDYCRRVSAPILLRAADLSYEHFSRYRTCLDAVILEPSSNETLARYVIGLSRGERRGQRRLAEIH